MISQNPFGLIPKVFNAVDVVFSFCKRYRVIDAFMLKAAHIQRVAGTVGVRVDDAIRPDFAGISVLVLVLLTTAE